MAVANNGSTREMGSVSVCATETPASGERTWFQFHERESLYLARSANGRWHQVRRAYDAFPRALGANMARLSVLETASNGWSVIGRGLEACDNTVHERQRRARELCAKTVRQPVHLHDIPTQSVLRRPAFAARHMRAGAHVLAAFSCACYEGGRATH
jgi:hypothetical protein